MTAAVVDVGAKEGALHAGSILARFLAIFAPTPCVLTAIHIGTGVLWPLNVYSREATLGSRIYIYRGF